MRVMDLREREKLPQGKRKKKERGERKEKKKKELCYLNSLFLGLHANSFLSTIE